MNTEINAQCARLASLLNSRPNEALREEVEGTLESKWEGVQVWAGRVLATWGDRRSIAALRRWLESAMLKEAGWAVRGEAIRALCRCYSNRDIEWLLELYFGAKDELLRHELSAFVIALPEAAVRERIVKESRSAEVVRREAASAAARQLETWERMTRQRSKTRLHPPPRAGRKPKA